MTYDPFPTEKPPKPNDPGSPNPYIEPVKLPPPPAPEVPSPIEPTRTVPPSA